jgi:hypothetical protein
LINSGEPDRLNRVDYIEWFMRRTLRRHRARSLRDEIEIKNPAAPAVKREAEEDWGR